jgi:hypothetical protein
MIFLFSKHGHSIETAIKQGPLTHVSPDGILFKIIFLLFSAERHTCDDLAELKRSVADSTGRWKAALQTTLRLRRTIPFWWRSLRRSKVPSNWCECQTVNCQGI